MSRDYANIVNILRIMDIRDPAKTTREIALSNNILFNKLLRKANCNLFSSPCIQNGGDKNKRKINFESHDFYLFEFKAMSKDDIHTLYIKRNDDHNNEDCLLIFLFKDEKHAIIENISYYKNCAKPGLERPGVVVFYCVLLLLI